MTDYQEYRGPHADRSLTQTILETCAIVLIALTAFVGNSCVLWVFYKSKTFRKKIFNFFLINLAITDVLASGVGMPFVITCVATGRDVIGSVLGNILGIFSNALIYSTMFTTILIAMNRFFCVVKQQIYRKWFKPKSVIITITLTWIPSVVAPFVAFVSGSVEYHFVQSRFFYYGLKKDPKAGITPRYVGSVLAGSLPLLLMMYCYYKVKRTVQVHSNSVQNTADGNTSHGLSAEEINISKSLVALVVGFAVCWTTVSVLNIIGVYCSLPRALEMLITYLTCLSRAINPFIYNMFNRRFRIEFCKVFKLDRNREQVSANA